MKTVSYKEFATLYCESQRSTPQDLYATLEGQQRAYSPNGWMLLECVDLASSRLGSRCILPYGPRNTYKDLPSGPMSPRGLASDMSNVIAVLRAEDLQYPAVS